MYAQTIAYGLFAARLNSDSGGFTRQRARELVQKSNPFLRQLFDYIAGINLDEGLAWIVDDLAEVFRYIDLEKLLYTYFEKRKIDPFLHFYETFLDKYDKAAKKKRGVYYTPAPVVKFIVNAVDEVLRDEFNLSLADNSRIKYNDKETFKVQILDPAAGTGTFLAECVNKIYENFKTQKGVWSDYAARDLIPRLNGFEIMMTPYVMCHLKLEHLLKKTGVKTDKRFNVYLTNALEEGEETKYTLFRDWLAQEARSAGKVKKGAPIMVVLGNPPYSVSSCNKNEYIDNLLSEYKKDLNEKNIQPLSDDYIKFIRLGEHFIEKNKEGILAYITNNSFLDGIIHRNMRKHLIETFDKIYILNLHGNAKKNECSPNGSKDENVFDIQQGVSINIFIKSTGVNIKSKCGSTEPHKKENVPAQVYYKDVWGLRENKFEYLEGNNLKQIDFEKLEPKEPYYFFTPQNHNLKEEYEKGFKIDELMKINSSGVTTHHDNELVSFLPFDTEYNQKYLYRPFDIRYINYDLEKVVRHRYEVMKHFIKGENVGLVFQKQTGNNVSCILSSYLIDRHSVGGATFCFPLYLYDNSAMFEDVRRPNLNPDMIRELEARTKLRFTPENAETPDTFPPIDILDYIYAVLYSDNFREKYKEFLKIDFPVIPYPDTCERFIKLKEFGAELRKIHLFETPLEITTTYPESGNNEVKKIEYKDGKVYINDAQYFGNVPDIAWNFYIGGYQPAQKWLKDRKNRTLNYDDIIHYQKIITALNKTADIMQKIDKE